MSELTARAAWSAFLLDRRVNREFYERVAEDKFDFRMVETKSRRSDSPRESLAHQIRVQREYMRGIETGRLEFGALKAVEVELRELPKLELLALLDQAGKELEQMVCDPGIEEKRIEAPWSDIPLTARELIGFLQMHEVLHTGWNLAVMDHLEMERFPALRELWG